MIRLAPSVAMRVIRAQIRGALDRGDLEALRRLRHQLLMTRIEFVRAIELGQIMRPVRTRIEAAIASLGVDQFVVVFDAIREAIQQLQSSLQAWFEQTLYGEAAQQADDEADALIASMTPEQIRAATDQPVDSQGMLKPPPGDVPPSPTDQGMSLTELLLRLSPLLVLIGDAAQNDRIGLRSLLFPDVDDDQTIRSVMGANRPDVSAPWQGKVSVILAELTQITATLERTVRERQPMQQAIRDIRRQFDQTQNQLVNELRHESLRTKGIAQDLIPQSLPQSVYVGYTLHSRFLDTTAPDHAARDGQRFYLDNREGSAAPWSDRIIPPYRKNCVCFTVPILESPDGDEYNAEFGLRVSRNQLISIREVGTWQAWFDAQLPWVQKRLMGERRWFAASSVGLGNVTWADFVDRRGKILSPRRLAAESQSQRLRRRAIVQEIIRRQAAIYFRAWGSGNNRFGTDPRIEQAYRQRLDAFLRRLSP